VKIFIAIGSALLLANCAGQMPASVSGGECRVFNDPGFAVRGQRIQDKRWIGATQEKGIEVCGWKRPRAEPIMHVKATPVQAAAPMPAPQAEPQVESAPLPPVVTPPPVKRHWYNLFHKKPKT
jgi:hypothetical protein